MLLLRVCSRRLLVLNVGVSQKTHVSVVTVVYVA
jgi:hypothetical protein